MPKPRRLFYRTISIVWRNWLLSAMTVVALALGAFYIWFQLGLTPVAGSHGGTFRVGQGDSIQTIATNLQASGYIHSRQAFLAYVAFHGLLRRMQSGVYLIPDHSGAGVIAEMIAHGRVNTKRLTVPEGVTIAKVKELAATAGVEAQ